MTRHTRILLSALGALTVATSAQSPTKIYGFADANFTVNQLDNSFTKQFVGNDTISMNLGHANVYFDFKPNDKVSALVEVGLASRPMYEGRTDAQAPAVITFNGQPITDAQAKAIIVQAQLAQLVFPAGTPQAMIDGARAQVPHAVDSIFDPVLAQIRSQSAAQTTQDKYGLNLERVHIDINFMDELKLRFGKFITPAGVWNVDHGSPVVLTVRQPLQTTTAPIFPESQLGMMALGSTSLGTNDLNYAAYVSAGRIDGAASQVQQINHNAIDNITDIAYGGHVGIKMDLLKSIALGASYFNGPIRQKFETNRLSFALEDLLQGKTNPRDYTVTDTYWRKERETVAGVDAKVEISRLLLQAEYNYGHRENELAKGGANLTGWYVLGAWAQPLNADFTLTPYLMYESLSTDTSGAGASGAFNSAGLSGLHTVQLGLNTTIYTNVHIKTEYMFLSFSQDKDTWMFQDITESNLKAGIWSTQVSVAF